MAAVVQRVPLIHHLLLSVIIPLTPDSFHVIWAVASEQCFMGNGVCAGCVDRGESLWCCWRKTLTAADTQEFPALHTTYWINTKYLKQTLKNKLFYILIFRSSSDYYFWTLYRFMFKLLQLCRLDVTNVSTNSKHKKVSRCSSCRPPAWRLSSAVILLESTPSTYRNTSTQTSPFLHVPLNKAKRFRARRRWQNHCLFVLEPESHQHTCSQRSGRTYFTSAAQTQISFLIVYPTGVNFKQRQGAFVILFYYACGWSIIELLHAKATILLVDISGILLNLLIIRSIKRATVSSGYFNLLYINL